MVVEGPFDKFGAPRPAGLPLGNQIVHLHDPRRREGARERRGGARGKGERGGVAEIEIALDLGIGPAAMAAPEPVGSVEPGEQRGVGYHSELARAGTVAEPPATIE